MVLNINRIFTILMISFLSAVAIEEDHVTQPQILLGGKVHLLCEYEKPITGCRFNIPGELYEIELVPNRKFANQRFEYFGRGFNFGDCGLTINNVTIENHGIATCIMILNKTFQHELMAEIKIINKSDLHMTLPKIKILNSSPLKVGQTLAAECITKSSDRVANISWLLNDRILNGSNTTSMKKYERDKGFVYEIKSTLMYDALDADDNKRVLKCRTKFSNNSNDFIDATLSLIIANDTNHLVEPKIGESFDISIKFLAYPRVLSSRWKVNKRTIYYGKATDEFSSRELKYLGNNQWRAILHLTNVTDENIHYNYSLQVNDSKGTKYYNVRLDNGRNKTTNEVDMSTEKSISTNAIASTKFKSNSFRQRTKTMRQSIYNNATSNNNNNTHIDRRTKVIRKQQHKKNTSITITEMTSVTSTTTQANIVAFIMTEANTNDNDEDTETERETEAETTTILSETEIDDVEKPFIKYENTINITDSDAADDDNGQKELNVTSTTQIIKNLFDITYEIYNTTESVTNTGNFNGKFENFFITTSFTVLILVMCVFTIMLCHYRRQVSILKTEIIQMNLENYYNQSCLYPSNFNDYSPTSIQRNGVTLFYDNNKSPLSDDSDTSSNFVQTYNTNSHLYQSIDDIVDTDVHVYDEIINSMEMDEEEEEDENDVERRHEDNEKLNNYENNESLNSINEILIPQHCHSLMTTIQEEDEYESSQIQKLANLESTYI